MTDIRFNRRKRRRVLDNRLVAKVLAALIGLGAIGWVYREPLQAAASPSCAIRGNISKAGERIYHVPGQRYHPDVIVHWWRGERWFCSETEAMKAGWRRARI